MQEPMQTRERAELFRRTGPDVALKELWARLQSRDLSGDEALARLGALHHELGQSRADDPKVYAGYSRFMQALDRQMPAVQHYVVATWTENRYTRRGREVLRQEAVTAGDSQMPDVEDPPDAAPAAAAVSAVDHMPAGIEVGESSEEHGEPEEEDDKEGGPLEAVKSEPVGREADGEAVGDEPDEEVQGREEHETPEEEPEQPEDGAEPGVKQEEASDAEEAEPAEPVEQAAASEGEAADEATPEGEASESNAEPAPEEDGGQPEAEASESASATETGGGGAEEQEWPAEEHKEPGEPIEGLEEDGGAEGEAPAGEG